MKPSQKIIVACRQTADSARRLCDWLDANPAILGAAHSAVIEDIEGTASRLAPIAGAAEQAPVIGVIGGQSASKSDLVLQLLGTRGPTQTGEFGSKPVDVQMLRHVLGSEGGNGGCLAVRLTSAERPSTPRGYPIRILLLSEVDIAAILATSRLAAAGPAPTPLALAEVDRLFIEASSRVSLQPVPGIAGRDILELREIFTSHWAEHPFLRGLTTTRYFDRLRDVAALLKEADRRALLSVLWGCEPATTELFHRLCATLDELGHGSEAYVMPEALIGKDRVTGWLVRHPQSIADASTILAMTPARSNAASATISIVTRYGQTVDVDRSVLAALAAELPVVAGPGRLTDMAPADLIDFPSQPIISDDAVGEITTDHRPVGPSLATIAAPNRQSAFAVAVTRYIKTKPSFLFQRATRRRDVTCLVLVVDPAVDDDATAPLISDWIETAQGASPSARERVRRGLFVAAARPAIQDHDASHLNTARDTGAASDFNGSAGARVLAMAHDLIGTGEAGAASWSPGRSVDHIYWFSRAADHVSASVGLPTGSRLETTGGSDGGVFAPETSMATATAAGSLRRSNGALLTSEQSGPGDGRALAYPTSQTARHSQRPGSSELSRAQNYLTASPPRRTVGSGVSHLAAELARVATPRVKAIQLGRAVAEVRRTLRFAVARHYVSNDPLMIAEWRRSTAVVACNRLAALVEQRQLGRLLRVLLPSEDEFLHAIVAAQARPVLDDEPEFSRSDLAVPSAIIRNAGGVDNDAAADDPVALSGAAMTYWFTCLKRAARSRQTCRNLGIDGTVLHHIVDELQSGASHLGLADDIAGAYRRANPAGDVNAIPLAAYAFRMTAAYLEGLSGAGDRGDRSGYVQQTSELQVADGSGSGYASTMGGGALSRRGGRFNAERWEHAFAALVDDNIAAANMGSSRGDKDRELGTLIQLFAPGPFEGEA